MNALDQRAVVLTEYLQLFAGKDPYEDAVKSGYIRAIRDLLKIELDDTKETE